MNGCSSDSFGCKGGVVTAYLTFGSFHFEFIQRRVPKVFEEFVR